MSIYKLLGIKVNWSEQKTSFLSEYSHLSEELKRVLMGFVESIDDVAQLDYDRMFEIITDEIRNQGVQEPAMVSWLTDQQQIQAAAEWKRNPADINFIKSIDDPYTVQFNYSWPNFNYFINH